MYTRFCCFILFLVMVHFFPGKTLETSSRTKNVATDFRTRLDRLQFIVLMCLHGDAPTVLTASVPTLCFLRICKDLLQVTN